MKLVTVMTIAALQTASLSQAQDAPPSPGVPPAPPAAPVEVESVYVEVADAAEPQLEREKARIDAELRNAERAIVEVRSVDSAAARKQLAEVRAQVDRQMANAQKAIVLAQAGSPGPDSIPVPPGAVLRQRLNAIVGRAPSKALLIRFDPADSAAQANLEEDLAVMARVFEKSVVQKLGDEEDPKASGIRVLFAPEGGSGRNLYLDGYGALFTMSVRFPLLAPEKTPEEEKPKESADSSWEDARRDLYGQHDEWNVGDMFRFDRHGGEPLEYDAGKVERLRKALLDGLKSASNIRGLKSDDWVSVVVFGGATSPATRVDVLKAGAKPDPRATRKIRDERTKNEFAVVEDGSARVRSGSVLALRVKKSDVDDFAKGRVDADQFARKVSMATYAADTGGWSSDFRFF